MHTHSLYPNENAMKQALSAVSLAMLVGCGADPAPAGPAVDLTVDTLNVGLAGSFIPYEPARQVAVVAAIAQMPSDIVCVQEAWRQSDKDAILAGARTRFPYAYSTTHNFDSVEETIPNDCATLPVPTTAPCSEAMIRTGLNNALTCLSHNCSTMVDSDMGLTTSTRCAAAMCFSEASALLVGSGPAGLRCYGCLASNLPTATFSQIRDRCTNTPNGSYAFEGQSGVMILSRYPLSEQRELVLPGTWNRRVVLRATATLPNGAKVGVYCNHLTPAFEGVTYPYIGRYGCGETGAVGWTHEQLMQTQRLVSWVTETNGTNKALVLGDFNSSVAGTGYQDESPETITLLRGAYTEALAPGFVPQCTYCSNNTLVDTGTVSTWIDHIFMRGIAASAVRSTTRTFTEPTVPVTGGTVTMAHITDHYGLRSVISVSP